ncbi:glycoside hydrolase family 2 protein [Bifidobacterium favimelis]|uniref:beta-mannosidase n=1 Tax=Bifidobacterium favimelis TaxID=3122979 RepID=A0ABU8ZNE8_9BIFI
MPSTFVPIDSGWTVRALNPQEAPADLRDRLARGVPARVPGEVTLDLVRAGLIPDPFDGANEESQQWIGDMDWSYSCLFRWGTGGEDRQDLVAYGLDTVASVSLNGRPVAHTCNYHRSYRWPVDGLLQEGENRIEVAFSSPVRHTEDMEALRGHYFHTEHHAFNQLRKPAYQFGWDWGIDVANAGIWRPIGIDSWSGVRIRAVRPLVDVDPDGDGLLNVTFDVERAVRSGEEPVPFVLHLHGQGTDLTCRGQVEAGRSSAAISLRVPRVRLWWPAGYGDHPLYDLEIRAGEGTGRSCWQGRVGFRTVRVDTRADGEGRPFQIIVNGLPIHARGYNLVPLDAFPSRVGPEDCRRRIEDLSESNSNMVRAWGGSVYESDDFYDLADEEGIMVWQDFMLACAAYPEDAATRAEVEAEAVEHINRLSCHPSLVVWNGSNENYVAYAQWAGFKESLRDDDLPVNEYGYGEKGWGDLYYSHIFPALLARLDPTRIYLPSSPMSFSKYVDANQDTDGTMHIWDVWNRADYRRYADYRPRFADEFGYQAPPAWSTLTRVVHDSPLDPFGPQMLVHQKAAGGNIKLARGMRSHLTPGDFDDVSYTGLPDGTGPATQRELPDGSRTDGGHSWLIPGDRWADMEDWHWACQLQQAQAIRFGVAHMRSLEPFNAGALIWQLNDDWPVVSWAAVDYDGHRKPLWYVSRDVFAPCLATIQPRVSQSRRAEHSWEGSPVGPDRLALVLVNDTRTPWKGSWKVTRQTIDGQVLAAQDLEADLSGPGQACLLLDPQVATCDDPARQVLVASPADDRQGPFSRVIYNPAEVVDQALDPSPLQGHVEAVEHGYRLTLDARSYARDIFCMVDKVDPQARIDGGMDTLLPGESLVWSISTEAVVDPSAFLDPRVLRSANDLKAARRG